MNKIIVPGFNNIIGVDGKPFANPVDFMPDIKVNPVIELKPCPFCGGEAEVKHDKRIDMYYVTCPDCKVETDVNRNMEKPIATWNRRVYK